MTRYALKICWSEEDKGFVVEVPDLPGCSAWGATEADAAHQAPRAIAACLEATCAAGREIPAPSVPIR
jgi:predicted RNase H-like HicB family nuclease